LKKNIKGTWKTLEDRKERRIKGYLQEENYLGGSQQESYLDSQIRGTTRNIGKDLREIGEDGKKNKLEIKELWRQSRKKKRKLSKKSQEIGSGQKKIIIRWGTYRTHTMSYKSLEQGILRER